MSKPTGEEIAQQVAKKIANQSNIVTAEDCINDPGILLGRGTTGSDAQLGAGLKDDALERLRINLNTWVRDLKAPRRIPVGTFTGKSRVSDANKATAACFDPKEK
jgi:hypothetical protein